MQKEKKQTSEIIQEITNYLASDKIIQSKSKTCEKHLVVDYLDFIKFSPELEGELISNPIEFLECFAITINAIRDDDEKKNIKARFSNVERIESNNIRIRDIRVKDYNQLKVVTGVIRQISNVYAEVISIKFDCPNCGNIINVLQPRFESKKEPTKCACGRKGKFTELSNVTIDSQKIVIEEELETIEGSQQPNKLNILLQYGLTSKDVDKISILGSRVSITGIILSTPKIERGHKMNELEKYMEANYITPLDEKYKEIEITQDDKKNIIELSKKENILEILSNSFAPNIHGYSEIKKAIVLQLFGGVRRFSEKTKQWSRGDFHILLIGDPGTGKTQLAKTTEPLALKYKYCSGTSSSKAGLTYMVSKDDFIKTWTVEAGAVVLANNGLCVVDEIDKINEETTNSLHSAMEEQVIEIDKANIHTRLTARTKILTCANWKDSRYNPYEPIYSQINLPDSLISRHDLFFKFIDIPDKEKDKKIMMASFGMQTETEEKETIDYDLFHKYIIHASSFEPKISDLLMQKIAELYSDIRSRSKIQGEEKVISITARQGQAFRRLMEASARIRLSDCNENDLLIAKDLIEYSLKEFAGTEEGVDIDRIETGFGSEKRHLIYQVRKTIDTLSQQVKHIPVEDILSSFTNQEREVEEALDKMLHNGEIYEPKRGFYSKL